MVDKNTVYQHGTLALLMDGQYQGTLPYDQLLNYGDTGIGTTQGLQYETIALGGHLYGIEVSGKVSELNPKNVSAPFATVHFDNVPQNQFIDLKNNSTKDIEQLISEKSLANSFVAITLAGNFNQVSARAVPKQDIDQFVPFAQVAQQQESFVTNKDKGTLVGYYSPVMYNGTTAAGLHLHFINQAHDFGGHVIDFEVANGSLGLQVFSNFNLHLPIENNSFNQRIFDFKKLESQINDAEK